MPSKKQMQSTHILVALHQDIHLPDAQFPLPETYHLPMVDSVHTQKHGYVLQAQAYTIGRNPQKCQIVIDRRRITVSGVQAKLAYDGTSSYTISDCDSANGTYINGKELGKDIPQPYQLSHADEICLGPGNNLLLRYYRFLDESFPLSSHTTDTYQEIEETNTLLTKREHAVLSLLARGMGKKEIAGELTLSEHTVNSHLKNIYGKLQVNKDTEAIAQARRQGLV